VTTLIKDCRYRCAGAGGGQAEVYLTFSSRFERIWLEPKKRLPQYMEQKPANIGLRSQYALRLYSWAKKHAAAGEKIFHQRYSRTCGPGSDTRTGSLIGKRSGSRYEAGKRTGAWVKIKLHQEQEFVIGGYTEPEGPGSILAHC
jgi:hypothetical protein